MFYPPLCAVSRRTRVRAWPMPGRVREASLPVELARAALIAVPVIMARLDVVENGCIAAMLWTWPDLSLGLVRVSSLADSDEDHDRRADRNIDGRACRNLAGTAEQATSYVTAIATDNWAY